MKNEQLERLQEALFAESEYLYILNTINRYEESKQRRLVLVHKCIPCIMHLRNRVVEKIIAMLLKRGYLKRNSKEDIDSYIKAIKITIIHVYLAQSTKKLIGKCL